MLQSFYKNDTEEKDSYQEAIELVNKDVKELTADDIDTAKKSCCSGRSEAGCY
jgi:hypothetical protein